MSATNQDTTSSTPQFIAALVTGAVIVSALTGVFILLHKKYRRVYQTRYELAPDEKRPPNLPHGFIGWWRTILTQPDALILEMNGPDAYFFVRFLKVFGIWMLVPYFLLTFIILIPVSAASPNNGESGLNRLTFGNVAPTQQNRHIAHLLVALILIAWTCFLIYREYVHLVKIRQSWLASSTHQRLARTRSVVLVDVPEDLMSSSALLEVANSITHRSGRGEGTKVWLSRKVKDLEKVFDDRNKECARLEAGESKLLAKVTKNVKKGKTPTGDAGRSGGSPMDTERADADAVIDKYLTPKEKGKLSWKQGLLGLVGKKMDRKQSPGFIREKNTELNRLRDDQEKYPLGNVAFLRFQTQHEAHVFARMVNKDKSRKMIKSGIEVIPEDIIWNNTTVDSKVRKAGKVVSWSLTIGLIIIWAALLTFVGAVSNIDSLCAQASWLAWICRLPSAVVGIIKGILPPAIYAIVFAVLPIFLRFCLNKQGTVRTSDLELQMFSRYWLFQVIHGFLIVTLASGLIAALSNLGDTVSNVPSLLANNLPKASIFFLTLILASNLSGAAKTYSRAVPFVMYLLRPILGGKTPRKFWISEHKMASFQFGVLWPTMCLVILIIIVYSIIQPVITIVGMFVMCLLYIAYKYILGWCADQAAELETGGLYYPKVLRTVFTALYIEEIFLAALFFLTTGPDGRARAKSGLAGGVIMVIAGVCTIAFHFYLTRRFTWESIIYTNSSLIGGTGSSTKLTLAPTVEHDEEDDRDLGEQYGMTTGWHARAFDHPALWKRQPVIWLARDQYGVSDAEVARINGEEVESSNVYADLDKEAKMHVERAAPDEEHQVLV